MPKSKTRRRGDKPPPRRPPEHDVRLGGPEHADDDGAIIVATGADGSRHAAVLPRSIARLSEDQTYWVKALQRNAIAQEGLRQELDGLVDHARDEGVSWAAIGWSLGTTGEAARQRWGDFDPGGEPR